VARTKAAALKTLDEEERLLAKEEAIEQATTALQGQRQAQERDLMKQYEEMKKTQDDTDAIEESRYGLMKTLESREKRLREKERALADRKITLSKRLEQSKETELGEMQLRLLENMARPGVIHFTSRWSPYLVSRHSLWPFDFQTHLRLVLSIPQFDTNDTSV